VTAPELMVRRSSKAPSLRLDGDNVLKETELASPGLSEDYGVLQTALS